MQGPTTPQPSTVCAVRVISDPFDQDTWTDRGGALNFNAELQSWMDDSGLRFKPADPVQGRESAIMKERASAQKTSFKAGNRLNRSKDRGVGGGGVLCQLRSLNGLCGTTC